MLISVWLPTEGWSGMSDVHLLSEISGLSFDSSLVLLQVLLLFLSCHFFYKRSILLTFCPQNSPIPFIKRQAFFVWLYRVEQVGYVSWQLVFAAFFHMALVFAIMHLCNIFIYLFLSIPLSFSFLCFVFVCCCCYYLVVLLL